MRESIILISTPLETLPAGGFIRDARVLPYFSKSFKARGTSTVIYIPVNSVVSAIKLAIKGGSDINEAFELVTKDLANNIGRSGVEAPLLEEALIESLPVLKWELNHENPSAKVVNKLLSFGNLYIYKIKSVEQRPLKGLIRYINSSFDKVLFAYSMNENIEHFISLTNLLRSLKLSGGIMIHEPLYTYSNISLKELKSRLTVKIASFQLNTYLRNFFISVTETGLLKLIQAISPASLLRSFDLFTLAHKYGVKVYIPRPANALDKEVLEYRNLQERELVAVYFGRLSPDKGLYDLLYVWSRVERNLSKAKLLLIGSFISEKVRRSFNELKSRLNLRNVEYLGHIKDRKKLYELVAKAKVLIYPSHQDAFSLTVLEAVALGLLCVAYEIPALRYVYKEVPSVTLVKEGDVENMSRAVVKALEASYDDYLKIQSSPKLLKFLETYSSWKNVAMAELSNVLCFLRE